jgi:hypothetical protein
MTDQCVTKADVNGYVIEQSTSQLAAYVEPDCRSFFRLVAPFRTRQRKHEVIIQIIGGRRKNVALGRLGIVFPLDVHIQRCSGPLLEAKVKSECALE